MLVEDRDALRVSAARLKGDRIAASSAWHVCYPHLFLISSIKNQEVCRTIHSLLVQCFHSSSQSLKVTPFPNRKVARKLGVEKELWGGEEKSREQRVESSWWLSVDGTYQTNSSGR